MTAVFRPFWHGRGTDALWHFRLILSTRTTGARGPATSASSAGCLWSYLAAVVPSVLLFIPLDGPMRRSQIP